jgi:hypothetical protein
VTVGKALVVSGRTKHNVSEYGSVSVFRWETFPESVPHLSLIPEDEADPVFEKLWVC